MLQNHFFISRWLETIFCFCWPRKNHQRELNIASRVLINLNWVSYECWSNRWYRRSAQFSLKPPINWISVDGSKLGRILKAPARCCVRYVCFWPANVNWKLISKHLCYRFQFWSNSFRNIKQRNHFLNFCANATTMSAAVPQISY